MGNNELYLIKLEKLIKGKILSIKNETVTPKESNIGGLFKSLKLNDEVLYDELILEYKEVLKTIKE